MVTLVNTLGKRTTFTVELSDGVKHVATASGVTHYHAPIGTPIILHEAIGQFTSHHESDVEKTAYEDLKKHYGAAIKALGQKHEYTKLVAKHVALKNPKMAKKLTPKEPAKFPNVNPSLKTTPNVGKVITEKPKGEPKVPSDPFAPFGDDAGSVSKSPDHTDLAKMEQVSKPSVLGAKTGMTDLPSGITVHKVAGTNPLGYTHAVAHNGEHVGYLKKSTGTKVTASGKNGLIGDTFTKNKGFTVFDKGGKKVAHVENGYDAGYVLQPNKKSHPVPVTVSKAPTPKVPLDASKNMQPENVIHNGAKIGTVKSSGTGFIATHTESGKTFGGVPYGSRSDAVADMKEFHDLKKEVPSTPEVTTQMVAGAVKFPPTSASASWISLRCTRMQ
jgi:hypothetical protein